MDPLLKNDENGVGNLSDNKVDVKIKPETDNNKVKIEVLLCSTSCNGMNLNLCTIS